MTRDSVPSADEVKERIFQELSSFEQLEAALTVRSDSKESVVKPGGSAEWTNVLLNIVLRIGADCGFEVYPRRKYFARQSRGTNSDYDEPLNFALRNSSRAGGSDRALPALRLALLRHLERADHVDGHRVPPARWLSNTSLPSQRIRHAMTARVRPEIVNSIRVTTRIHRNRTGRSTPRRVVHEVVGTPSSGAALVFASAATGAEAPWPS